MAPEGGRRPAVLAVVMILGLGLGVRALSDGGLAQHSGTALYAAMSYAGLFVLWPAMRPVRAGAVALAYCWAVEFFQLTGIPAELSGRSVVARLVLGARFDWVDVAWYPAGIVPLVVLHLLVMRRAAADEATAGPGSRVGHPPA